MLQMHKLGLKTRATNTKSKQKNDFFSIVGDYMVNLYKLQIQVVFMNIDWQSEQSYLLLNPRHTLRDIETNLNELVFSKDFPSHIWLATSGSTQIKLVALHKKAILSSATAVNKHLHATAHDIWINPLPTFHVGGLGIWARAHLSGTVVHAFSENWSPHNFRNLLCDRKGTLTALVPTQIYDLVVNNLRAPSSLRAVIVGGGSLEESLYEKARELGWPLLPSYGLSECASQVATADLGSLNEPRFPNLKILSHVKVKVDEDHVISLCSPALLTAYALFDENALCFKYPVKDGWFLSQDKGILSDKSLTLLGRLGDFVKIGGESVELGRLEKIFEEIKLEHMICFDVVIAAVPDDRLGHAIHLFTTDAKIELLQRQFNDKVMPYERIRKAHLVPAIPRSPLNKVLKNQLVSLFRNK